MVTILFPMNSTGRILSLLLRYLPVERAFFCLFTNEVANDEEHSYWKSVDAETRYFCCKVAFVFILFVLLRFPLVNPLYAVPLWPWPQKLDVCMAAMKMHLYPLLAVLVTSFFIVKRKGLRIALWSFVGLNLLFQLMNFLINMNYS